MKKIILLIIMLSLLNINLYVFSSDLDNLKENIKIIEKETNTYGGENISLEQRVKNAEIYVFGVSKKGNLDDRITALSSVLGLSGLMRSSKKNNQESSIYEIENDVKANYPAIDKMEKTLFSSTYENENVYKRLDRLEKKVFGKISDNPLSERVSDLQDKLNEKLSHNKVTRQNFNYESEDYNYYSPASPDIDLSKIEKKLFKKSYANENTANRLSRLEEKLFSQKFDYEDEQTRLDRIEAVQKAAKSGTEYKINKFAKYAVAGAQIGGLLLLILAMIL